MNFTLTKEQKRIKEMAEQFASQYCEPEADSIDKNLIFPRDTWLKMSKSGLLKVNHSQDLGGLGIDPIAGALAIEAISAASLAHGLLYSLCGHIFQLLSKGLEQKNKNSNLYLVSSMMDYLADFA